MDEGTQKTNWKERLAKRYRLVVYRSDDMQEVRSFLLSVGNLYITLSGVVVILALGIISLIVFTPLKSLIPGYGKIEVNRQFVELVDQVGNLTDQIEAQETYIAALQKFVNVENDASDVSIPPAVQSNPIKTGPDLSRTLRADPLPAKEPEEIESIYQVFATQSIVKPVDGIVSSEFKPELRHFGVDVLAPKDSPIRAMMDGFVFSSSWDLETGYTLGIQHAENILSFYKHNSVLLKEKGTFVAAGEAVAIIGNTGTLSSGPHLHFEMWHNGKPVNPQDFVKF